MNKSYYLAIDIGASSGRHIIGWRENDVIKTDEIYRFPNNMEQADGHLTWNTERLLAEVRTGIAAAKENIPELKVCPLTLGRWTIFYCKETGR